MQHKLNGFTLMELIVVIMIVGVLSSIIFPQYVRTRERTMDKQAIAILKTIRSAQRAYKLDTGTYYPSSGSVTSAATINNNLFVELTDNGEWGYYIETQNSGTEFTARLSRNKGGYSRRWQIDEASENPSCAFVSGSNWCP
jgi:prepilin-type N-terminal cleavage/methylation domain-containing protein